MGRWIFRRLPRHPNRTGPAAQSRSQIRGGCSRGRRLRLRALEDRALLSTSAGANANLVADLYADVLGRLASPAEINYWTGQLAAGQSSDSVVVGFVRSVEHRQNVVNQVYQEFLKRAPEDAGLNYWVGVLGQGTSEFVLESFIVGSQEYYDRQGGDNAGFIRGLYREVLHRTTPPGPSEIAYWSGAMNAGRARSSVALGFIDSPEFAGVGVDQIYRDFLKRDSDAGGHAYWLSRLQQGATTFDIERFLLDSQEYAALAQRHLEPGATGAFSDSFTFTIAGSCNAFISDNAQGV